MRGYFGLGQLSAAEKSDILNQHKSVYNGYQTMQPEVSNTQPLYVYDFAGDKEGLVVNNKGEVKKYTNMGINEQVETKEVCDECGSMIMDGICNECGSGYMEEEMTKGSETCECGGTMYEGMCNECGSGYMEEETGHLDDIYKVRDLNLKHGDFDYVEGGGNDYGTFEGMHKNLYKEDREDMLSSIINSLTDDSEDDGFVDVEDFEPADEFIDTEDSDDDDDDDFMDFESSYTEDGVDDTDNEDDGYEDLNASEVTDGKLNEVNVEKLEKGRKYRFRSPGHEADIEFDTHHDSLEGGQRMYKFKKDDTGYLLGKNTIEDLMGDIEDEELGEQGGNTDDMDVSDVQSAYDFESNGPIDGYPVNEDDMYEPMESAWADDELEEGDIYGDAEFNEIDVSGVQGIYGDMKKPFDFDSNGPGIAGPYQHSSWGGGSTHSPKREEEFEEVDEDLKESFLAQKNKIQEMFNRFNKYN